MKTVKIKERLENAVDAFFGNEKSDDHTTLEFADNASIIQVEESKGLAEKNRTLLNVLKQVFLFFPGTFFLFAVITPLTIIAVNNPLQVRLVEGSLPLLFILFVAAIPMTWFGLGDLRKKEDCFIPLSIIGTSMLLGIFSGLVTIISRDLAEMVWNGVYLFCLFPITLIIPNLVKLWLNSTDEKKSL